LGVKFKKDARGQFAHSNLLTVLSPGGEIVHQQIGLNQSPQDTVKRLTELVHP
jgi:protein SCO1/2